MNALLLDIGNSRLKWARCERGHFVETGSFLYAESSLPIQFEGHWGSLLVTGAVNKLVVCSVAGEKVDSQVRAWWAKMVSEQTPPLVIEQVTAQAQAYGVQCAYTKPSQLGADRWAALVAARHDIDGACCVIDCGTALTIDLLSAEGRHEGGLIAPGMAMMRQSLQANTAQIQVDETASQSIFSVQDTAGAVQAGILAATVGAVQQVLQQCQELGRPKPICVVTGGDAHILLPALPEGSVHKPEWVLRGLAIIAGCVE